MSTAHFLNRLDEIDYWRALHKFPRVSGAYSKPEEFPSPGGFSSTNRESKCWRHAVLKKKLQQTQPAPPFTMVWK